MVNVHARCTDKLTDNHFIRTPHHYRQFALSLGKESPYIFCSFNTPNTDILLIRTLSMPPSVRINPLSPNGVQHQYSPNTIHTLLRD